MEEYYFDMSDDELAAALSELAASVDRLGELLAADRRSGLRPPRTVELLRATDEVAIPTLISILEAQIRLLEALQYGTRLVRGERSIRSRKPTTGPLTRRATTGQEAALEQLGKTLEQLRSRLESGDDERVETALDRTQSLYEELERRLAKMEPTPSDSAPADGYEIEIDDLTDSTDDSEVDAGDSNGGNVPARSSEPDDTAIDVEAELQTLRDQYRSDESDQDVTPDSEASADRDAKTGARESGAPETNGDTDGDSTDTGDDAEPKRGDSERNGTGEDSTDAGSESSE